MSKIILGIDTTDSLKSKVSINRMGTVHLYEHGKKHLGSQTLLPLIEKALKHEKLALSDLTDIRVKTGKGSFTGIRVGVTVANTLGWVLSIPVNGKSKELPKFSPSKFDLH